MLVHVGFAINKVFAYCDIYNTTMIIYVECWRFMSFEHFVVLCQVCVIKGNNDTYDSYTSAYNIDLY